jgi:hypothetical protein
MLPHSLMHRNSIWIALVAILSSFFVMLSPLAAQADPQKGTVIDTLTWNITELTATNFQARARAAHEYDLMLSRLRTHAGHPYVNQVYETTELPTEVLEVRIVRGTAHPASIYFNARTLYVAGFWAQNGGHRFFHTDESEAIAREVRRGADGGVPSPTPLLPWTGNYAQTPGGTERDTLTYGQDRLNTAIRTLENMGTAMNGSAQQRENLGRELVRLVQATAEAARFALIGDRIRGLIETGTSGTDASLGTGTADLENSWARIGDFVHDSIRFGNANPITLPNPRAAGTRTTFYTITGLISMLQWCMIPWKARS